MNRLLPAAIMVETPDQSRLLGIGQHATTGVFSFFLLPVGGGPGDMQSAALNEHDLQTLAKMLEHAVNCPGCIAQRASSAAMINSFKNSGQPTG